jgi:hypothetical protein
MTDDVAEPELMKDWLNWFLPASAPGLLNPGVEPTESPGGPLGDMDMMETELGKLSRGYLRSPTGLSLGRSAVWCSQALAVTV